MTVLRSHDHSASHAVPEDLKTRTRNEQVSLGKWSSIIGGYTLLEQHRATHWRERTGTNFLIESRWMSNNIIHRFAQHLLVKAVERVRPSRCHVYASCSHWSYLKHLGNQKAVNGDNFTWKYPTKTWPDSRIHKFISNGTKGPANSESKNESAANKR